MRGGTDGEMSVCIYINEDISEIFKWEWHMCTYTYKSAAQRGNSNCICGQEKLLSR